MVAMTDGTSSETLYVYGLTKAAPNADVFANLLSLKAVDGAGPPETRMIGDRSVICSPHDGRDIPRRRRNMLAHTRVLESAMAAGPLLPMRFGVVAASNTALQATLQANADSIEQHFATVSGCVELGLRISWPREKAFAALVNAEPSLKLRHAELQRRGAAAHYDWIDFGRRVAEALDARRKLAERLLLSRLRPLARDFVLRAAEEDNEALRADFLIEAQNEHAFVSAAEAECALCDFAKGTLPTIRCVGPAPAYNFVNLSLSPVLEGA